MSEIDPRRQSVNDDNKRNIIAPDKKEIILSSFLKFGFSSAIFLFLVYTPIYLQDIGFSGSQIGILTSVYTLSPLFLSAPFGMWNDKFSSRILIIMAIIGLGLFTTGFLTTTSYWIFLIIFVLGGISGNLFNVSSRSLVMKKIGTAQESADASEKIGIFNAGGQFAYGITGALGGIIIASYGFNTVFFSGLAITGCVLLAALRLEDEEVDAELLNISSYKGELLSKEFLILTFLLISFGFHVGVEKTSFSLYLKGIGITEDKIGIVLAMVGITMGFTAILSGRYLDRVLAGSKKRLNLLFIGALILSAGANIGFAFTSGFYSVFCNRFLHVLGDAVFFVLLWTSASRIFSVEKYGGASGLISFMLILGSSMGAAVSGYMGDIYGFGTAFIVAGVITLITLPVMKFCDL